MKIAFLVYDSRSGSTFLSNLITKYIEGVIVTPEIGLESLIKEKNLNKNNIDSKKFLRKNYLKNLNLTQDDISHVIKNSNNIYEIIEGILEIFLKKSYPQQTFHTCIIKYGKHIFVWKEILKNMGPDTKFIFIYRDPRGVINSKLKTPRPYYPFETFAWGGAFLAAIRWYQYVKEAEKIKKAGGNLYEIKYENLILSPEKELKKLANYLNANFIPKYKTKEKEYIIPEKEKAIHELVMKGISDKKRIESWRKELSLKDVLIIESVLYSLMQKKGYIPLYNLNYFKRGLIILKCLPETVFKIIRHYVFHFYFKIFRK